MKLHRHSCHWICLATILLAGSSCTKTPDEAAGAGLVQSEEQQPDPGYTIDGEAIISISAHVMNHPGGGQDIPAFEIPKEYHEEVLRFFNGGARFSVPIDPMFRGTLMIKTADTPIEIMVFCPSQSDEIIFTATEAGKFKGKSLREFVRTIEEARKAASNE